MGLLREESEWAQEAEVVFLEVTPQTFCICEHFKLSNHLIIPDNPVKKVGLLFLAPP